jgi:hypothetical protein
LLNSYYFYYGICKARKINNSHCFWSNSTKKYQKINPNCRLLPNNEKSQDFRQIMESFKALSYLDFVLCSMNQPLRPARKTFEFAFYRNFPTHLLANTFHTVNSQTVGDWDQVYSLRNSVFFHRSLKSRCRIKPKKVKISRFLCFFLERFIVTLDSSAIFPAKKSVEVYIPALETFEVNSTWKCIYTGKKLAFRNTNFFSS